MRDPQSACDRRAMARTSITIDLEFDEAVDSPLGTARLPDGTSRTFHGWLALAEAIDALAATSLSHGPTAHGASRESNAGDVDRPTGTTEGESE